MKLYITSQQVWFLPNFFLLYNRKVFRGVISKIRAPFLCAATRELKIPSLVSLLLTKRKHYPLGVYPLPKELELRLCLHQKMYAALETSTLQYVSSCLMAVYYCKLMKSTNDG